MYLYMVISLDVIVVYLYLSLFTFIQVFFVRSLTSIHLPFVYICYFMFVGSCSFSILMNKYKQTWTKQIFKRTKPNKEIHSFMCSFSFICYVKPKRTNINKTRSCTYGSFTTLHIYNPTTLNRIKKFT